MIEIKETKDRKVLGEGRNQGMGFALLKKVEENKFETVNPISPCKDYLAEVVFTENTGLSTSGCGLQYPQKLGILEDKVSYLVFKNMKTNGRTFSIEGKSFETYSKEIKDGIKNIENFINKFQMKFRGFTKCMIEEANDDQFLVTFDTRWAQSTHSISLLSLLLRIGKNYTDNKKSITRHLISIDNKCIDYSLVNSCFKNIVITLENKKLPPMPEAHIKARKASSSWTPHNYGIGGWNGKYE